MRNMFQKYVQQLFQNSSSRKKNKWKHKYFTKLVMILKEFLSRSISSKILMCIERFWNHSACKRWNDPCPWCMNFTSLTMHYWTSWPMRCPSSLAASFGLPLNNCPPPTPPHSQTILKGREISLIYVRRDHISL